MDEFLDKKDSKKILINIIIIGILSFLLLCISFTFASSIINMDMIKSYFKSGMLLLLNYIPIFLLMSIIWIISNRLWVGFTFTGLLIVIGGIANRTKLTYRDDPVIFADVTLISEAGMMAQEYELPITPRIVLTLLGVLAIIYILKKFFDYRIESGKVRLVTLLAILLISTAIFGTFYFDESLYSSLGDEDLINIWIESERFQSKGFVYPFIYSATDLMDDKLENYDEKKAEKDLYKFDYDDIEEDKKVHVISIMLEAYNDFSKFDTVELNEDVYEFFHELQEESVHGELITNVFAGDTINTERAFLTGYQNQPKYNKDTNSFVWYLKEQGYFTDSMHPITGSFYNRRNVNKYLGFDNFDYQENKYEKEYEGEYDYLRDDEFFEYIIEGYEKSVKDDNPYFNFSVTYQNHGPYSKKQYHEVDYLKRQDHYEDEKYNIINNYLYGINKTGEALEDLIDYFRKEEEPVVVLLFGDHNPWLGEGNSVYEMLGIDLNLGEEEGFKNYYGTPYLIWGNEKAKEVVGKEMIGEREDIGPSNLMVQLFEELGWKGNEYYKYLAKFKEKVPVHNEHFFKEEGNYTKELYKENQELWENYRNVEHYYGRNFKYKGEK